MPSQCCGETEDDNTDIPEDLIQAVDVYQNDLPHSSMFPTEYRIWVRLWQQRKAENNVPKKLIDVYQACDPAGFPNVCILLQIALTLPITSCESERSLS